MSSLPKSIAASRSSCNKLVSSFKHEKEKDATHLPQVIEKVRDHPEFHGLPKAEIKKLAKKLSDTELMKEYFSEYLQENTHTPQVKSSPCPEGTDIGLQATASAVMGTTGGGGASINPDITESSASICSMDATHSDNFSRIQRIAAFPVKLFLTALPPDITTTQDNTFASTLETKYGPMHASLQIGQMMLEWGPHHLVVPHRNIPTEPVIKTDITRSLKVAAELRERAKDYRSSRSRRGSITGEVDLLFEIRKSIQSVIESVIQVMVSWNRFKYFHTYATNSQHFVDNIIAVLGIEEMPLPSNNLSDYIGRLKNDTTTQTSFRSHAKLDSYTRERIGELRTNEMEYLLTEYYRFHVASRVGAVREGEWECQAVDCQMQALERAIDRKELLITSLSHF